MVQASLLKKYIPTEDMEGTMNNVKGKIGSCKW